MLADDYKLYHCTIQVESETSNVTCNPLLPNHHRDHDDHNDHHHNGHDNHDHDHDHHDHDHH
jgi:hypothetical protein